MFSAVSRCSDSLSQTLSQFWAVDSWEYRSWRTWLSLGRHGLKFWPRRADKILQRWKQFSTLPWPLCHYCDWLFFFQGLYIYPLQEGNVLSVEKRCLCLLTTGMPRIRLSRVPTLRALTTAMTHLVNAIRDAILLYVQSVCVKGVKLDKGRVLCEF